MGRGWAPLPERPGLLEEPEGGRPRVNAPPSVRPHPPGTAPPPPQPHLEARFQPWTSRFPRGLLLVLVHISAGAVAALERCVWALPMGHGEPPCPLTSAVGDVRPRAPLNAPGAGSAGDSTWLLTWPCPPETWCCPGQLTPGALARPLPSWPRLLRSHPFRTQTAKTTNPNPAPGSRSALLPGLRGVRSPPGLLSSSLRTQKEEEASGCSMAQAFCLCPHFPGQSFQRCQSPRPMPHSGRGLPSPGAQWKVPTLGEGLEGASGEGGHLNTCLWLLSASVGTYPAATRPSPSTGALLGHPTPLLFVSVKITKSI